MDADMAGIKHPGEKKTECDPHDGDKRQASRPPAILTDVSREKRKKMVDEAQKIDEHCEKHEIKQNAGIEGSHSADRFFQPGGLAPLEAVPQEIAIRQDEIEDENDLAKNTNPGQGFPGSSEKIDIPHQV
jgi:hypothetical protein